MENLYKQLADDLTGLTGAKFTSTGYAVVNVGISAEQYALLEQVINATGLRVGVGTSAGMAIADLDDQKSAIDEIHKMTEEEPGRIARLEKALPLLEKKTGIKFNFDEGHTMLVSVDAIPSDIPSVQSSKNLRTIDDLRDKQIIAAEFRMDNRSINRAIITDIDIEKLALLSDKASLGDSGLRSGTGWIK